MVTDFFFVWFGFFNFLFVFLVDASTYAHFLFNAFDTDHNGSVSFEVRRVMSCYQSDEGIRSCTMGCKIWEVISIVLLYKLKFKYIFY